jgi:uncharacterized protein YaaQ
MLGRELLAALEREGFTITRRAQSYLWLQRGEETLLLDADADVADVVAERILEHARKPRA